MMFERQWRSIKSVILLFLASSGGHFVPTVGCSKRNNGYIQLTSLRSSRWIVALQVDRSAHLAFQNSHRIHQYLNPPNFYLWVFLKDRVYQNNPQRIAELKDAITQKIRGLAKKTFFRVIGNFARWIQVCHQCRDAHLKHFL